ncbi:MAG: hypothetical protein GXP25_24445 [Planctomycetes bacterium]|nr:hypothetical protein [Planctomycetota bacterium]
MWKVTPAQDDVKESKVQAFFMPAAGGEERAVKGEAVSFPTDPGIYVVVLRGSVILKDGKEKAVYFRSRPLNVLTDEEAKALLERLETENQPK